MNFDSFAALIREVADVDAGDLTPDTTLADSGLDSLALVLLLLHLEEHGVPLPEELTDSWTTVGDLYDQASRWYEPRGDAIDLRGPLPDATRAPLTALRVEGRHVFVVPLQPEHIPPLHLLAGTAHNAMALWPRGRTISRAEFEARLWDDAVLQLVVIDRSSRELLGLVRVADYHERDGHAQLSVLGTSQARTWLMEGVMLTIHRAFTMWPLRKLYLTVSAMNEVHLRSRDLIFRPEGSLRGHEYFDGTYHDLNIFALYRDDFFVRWNALQHGVPVA